MHNGEQWKPCSERRTPKSLAQNSLWSSKPVQPPRGPQEVQILSVSACPSWPLPRHLLAQRMAALSTQLHKPETWGSSSTPLSPTLPSQIQSITKLCRFCFPTVPSIPHFFPSPSCLVSPSICSHSTPVCSLSALQPEWPWKHRNPTSFHYFKPLNGYPLTSE